MPIRSLLVLALALFCAPTPTLSLPTPATDADVTAEAAAATKTYSLWSTAKRFFGFRQHLQEKLTPSGAGATSAPASNTMPTTYGVDFKRAKYWFCAKPEHKDQPLCSSISSTAGKLSAKPTLADSKTMFMAYCADTANKAKPFLNELSD